MEKEAEISLEQHEESSKVLENLKINRTVALNRYIFMAEVNSYFVNTELNQLKCNKMKLRHSTGTDICNYLKNLAETDKLAPMNIIKKVSSHRHFKFNFFILLIFTFFPVSF